MDSRVPQTLRDAIEKEELVVFLGAGASRNAGLPSWKALVSEILSSKSKYIEKSDSYLAALKDGILSPLEVLDKIKANKKVIYQVVEDRLKKTTSSELHKVLGKLTTRFITTNYDQLIEKNSNVDNIIAADSKFNLTKIDSDDSYVLKLHGDISSIDNAVVFSNQYEDLYSNEELSTFQLKKIFSSKHVLFIGFSFQDPYVKELFDYVSELFKEFGKEHFLISDDSREIDNVTTINIGSYEAVIEYVNSLLSYKTISNAVFEDENVIATREVDSGDIPPDVVGWVGRQRELRRLNNEDFKVIGITGIGGQGKSALASHYLNEIKDQGIYDVIEWRDFKEEDHKFFQKISSMIFSVSDKVTPEELAGLGDDELVTIFFKELAEKRAVFVLDNVDSYIDLEEFRPVNGIGLLFEKAIENDHKAKFIFTCRPFIQYAGVEFIQMTLTGLDEDSTIEFFLNENLPFNESKVKSLSRDAYRLTNGHPLWLSLILAQARRGEAVAQQFIEDIGSGVSLNQSESSLMSEKLLGSIWKSLNDRDRLVLRTLAETVRTETVKDYADILSGELNFNKFNRSLKALRNLNLLITKRNTDFIELHPLVKEYIRKNYPSTDRNRYISLLIRFYDKYVMVLKKTLSYKLSFDDFSNFIHKAELYINAGDYQNAISTLTEVHDAMRDAGYIEEFLRVSKILFKSVPWSKRQVSQLDNFDTLISDTCKSAAEFGLDDLADDIIKSYDELLENKEREYIHLCSVKAYVSWFRRDYKTAIEIADEALYMLQKGNQPDNYNIEHDRALALRDSGDRESIEEALNIFKGSAALKSLVSKDSTEEVKNGAMLGNIGKCLFLLDRSEDSIVCYCKSFAAIYGTDSGNRSINLGYASIWMAQALLSMKKVEPAVYFYRYALEVWSDCSPTLANRHKSTIPCDIQSDYSAIMNQDQWKVERFCHKWVSSEIGVNLN